MARTIKSVLDELDQRCDINVEDSLCFSEAAGEKEDWANFEKHKHHAWAFRCMKKWISDLRVDTTDETA